MKKIIFYHNEGGAPALLGQKTDLLRFFLKRLINVPLTVLLYCTIHIEYICTQFSAADYVKCHGYSC